MPQGVVFKLLSKKDPDIDPDAIREHIYLSLVKLVIRTKYDQTTGHKNTIPGTVLKNQLKKSFTRFRPICSPSFNTNSIPAGPSIIGGALKTALIPLPPRRSGKGTTRTLEIPRFLFQASFSSMGSAITVLICCSSMVPPVGWYTTSTQDVALGTNIIYGLASVF